MFFFKTTNKRYLYRWFWADCCIICNWNRNCWRLYMRNGNSVNYKRDSNCCLSSTQKKIESLISFCIFLVSYFICAFSHELYLNLVYSSRFRWLIKTAMRPVGPFDSSPSFAQHNDCVLVVGVSRPKLAAVFLTIMIISLFLTFHVLYDSAIYSIQVNKNNKNNSNISFAFIEN